MALEGSGYCTARDNRALAEMKKRKVGPERVLRYSLQGWCRAVTGTLCENLIPSGFVLALLSVDLSTLSN